MKSSKNQSFAFMLRLSDLAWKNIWRNKVRSGVILGAIAIGLSSGTFLSAFINGWIVGTVNRDIKTQISHIQIHDTEFLANYDIGAFFMREEVERPAGFSKLGRSDSEEKPTGSGRPSRFASRLYLTGMLASPHNALGVTAKGVFPDEEMQVTDVWKHIPDTMGVYLTDDTRNAIVISRKIAGNERRNVR